jgi:CheY-like chemotaxis protein
VLTDMDMPVLDGRSTIAALLVINPRVRLIAASGRDLSHSIPTDFGVVGLPFLAKPYTAASLLGIVREVLAR